MLTTDHAAGRPEPGEATAYYFTYIDRVPGDDVVGVLAAQLDEAPAFLSGISEERSLHRYAPDKWSLREVLGHLNDVVSYRTIKRTFFEGVQLITVGGVVPTRPNHSSPSIREAAMS